MTLLHHASSHPQVATRTSSPWLVVFVFHADRQRCAATPCREKAVLQKTGRAVIGTVVDRNDKPLPNVEIQVYRRARRVSKCYARMPWQIRMSGVGGRRAVILCPGSRTKSRLMVPGQKNIEMGESAFQIRLCPSIR